MGCAVRRFARRVGCAAVVLLAGHLVATNARAALIINVNEVGSDVVVTAAGTLNLTALSGNESEVTGGIIWAAAIVGSVISVGSPSSIPVDEYQLVSGPASFGTGAMFQADSGSGDLVALATNGWIVVPAGYISGAPLSSTSTFEDESLDSLGLTTGSYVYSWGTGPTADTLTLNIGVASVPEPSYAGPLALLIGACAARSVRRRK